MFEPVNGKNNDMSEKLEKQWQSRGWNQGFFILKGLRQDEQIFSDVWIYNNRMHNSEYLALKAINNTRIEGEVLNLWEYWWFLNGYARIVSYYAKGY